MRLLSLAIGIGLLAALAPGHVQATPADTLRGKVHDASGHPLVRAEVELLEAGTVTLTDRDGNFAIALPRYARFTLVASAAGFARTRKLLDAQSLSDLDITLQEAVVELPPVEVTSLRDPVAVGNAPFATSVVDQQLLRRNHSASLAHSLQSTAGVRSLSTGQQVGKPVLRGLFGSRVLVLESGLRLEDYSWSDEDAPSIDARMADRAEIIRGPASVLYGSDALGGVVNVIPEALPTAGAAGSFYRTGTELYFASNNIEAGTVLRAEGASGGFGWRGTAIGRFGQDLHTPDGELENTGFGAFNGEAVFGYSSSKLSSSLRYVRYGGEFKLLEKEGPPAGQEEEEEGPERKLADDRLQWQTSLPIGSSRFELKSQWQRHWLQEVADELTAPGQPKVEAPVFELLLSTLTTDALIHHQSGNLHGTVGVSGLLQSNDSRGVLPIVPDVSTHGAAAFAFEQLEAGRATLSAGARFDARSTDPTPTKGLAATAGTLSQNAFSGDLGVVLHASSAVSLQANVGRAWRAPTLFELYASGPRIGEARFEIGRDDLEPETSLDMDLGVKLQISRFDAEVTAFDNEIANFIFLAPTTEFRDGLRVHRHQQADARMNGVEAASHFQLRPELRVGAVYDVVRGSNLELEQPLPVIPPARARLEVELGTRKIGEHAQFGAALEHVSAKHRLAPAETTTGDYNLVHLNGGVDSHWHGRPLHIDLQVHNLLDASYYDFLSRYKDFALSPGRHLVLHFGLGI